MRLLTFSLPLILSLSLCCADTPIDPLLAHKDPFSLKKAELLELLGNPNPAWRKDDLGGFLDQRQSPNLFSGAIPLDAVEFEMAADGQLQRLIITLYGEGLTDRSLTATDIDALFAKCEAAASAWSTVKPIPHAPPVADFSRLPDDMPQAKRAAPTSPGTTDCTVTGSRWNSARGTVVLDRGIPLDDGSSSTAPWLRLRFAKPGLPDPDIFLEEVQDGFSSDFLSCPLDALVNAPAIWSMTREQFEARYVLPADIVKRRDGDAKNPYFEWLTTTKDRARFGRRPYTNLAVDLSIFGGQLPVEEAIIDFRDNKVAAINLNLYNRGDAGDIKASEFERRLTITGQEMGKQLGARPFTVRPDERKKILVSGFNWSNENTFGALEHNEEATSGKREFLRLRLVGKTGASGLQLEIAKLGDLPKNVKNDGDDTYISGLPMVDQGDKGYCAVASCQRVLEYYGIPCDQHQLAQMAGSDADEGTSSNEMAKALEKIDGRFKMDFKTIGWGGRMKSDEFTKAVNSYVDDGIPLIWSLQLGKFPEEPNLNPQTDGYHMRLIIGYNEADNQLLFTDTWGAGHELKRMDLDDAFQATTGLHVMRPTHR